MLCTVQKKTRCRLLIIHCFWFHREEKSPVSFVLFVVVCTKHVDRLKAIRNYSPAFIDGIVGVKKSQTHHDVSVYRLQTMSAKHQKTDMWHGKAVNMELQPTRTIKSILTSTPLGKAFASVTTEEWNRIVKLFDATYHQPIDPPILLLQDI